MKNLSTLVKEEVSKRVISILKSIEPELTEESKVILIRELVGHPTYNGLIRGILGKHFGFVEETRYGRISGLVNKIGNSLKVGFNITPGSGIIIAILYMEINLDYGEINRFSEAIVLNRNSETGELEQLPWLEWLLMRGVGPIVMKYHLVEGTFKANQSRSRKAIMMDDGYWGVPSEYAGTEHDNWITQSMEKAIDKTAEYARILLEERL